MNLDSLMKKERGDKIFICLKCKKQFFNVKKGEDHQKICRGVKKGFRTPKEN